MDCKKAQELFSLYFDHELSRQKTSALHNHLLHCPKCQKEFQELQQILEELRAFSPVLLPENYHHELMDKLQSVPLSTPSHCFKKRKMVMWKKWSRYLVACCLLLTILTGKGLYAKFQSVEHPTSLSATQSPPSESSVSAPQTSTVPKVESSPPLQESTPSEDVTSKEPPQSKTLPQKPTSVSAAPPTQSAEAAEEPSAKTAPVPLEPTEEPKMRSVDPPPLLQQAAPFVEENTVVSTESVSYYDITLTVEKEENIFQVIENTADSFQGKILSSDSAESSLSTITVELPTEQTENFVKQLESIGSIQQQSTQPSEETTRTNICITIQDTSTKQASNEP